MSFLYIIIILNNQRIRPECAQRGARSLSYLCEGMIQYGLSSDQVDISNGKHSQGGD